MRWCAAVVLSFVVSSVAYAQSARTFVSATGNDANPCSRLAPCRNFAAAVAAVANGGEVVVLDSAGYGPVTISKPVSIVSPTGIYGGITATSGDAIAISAPSTAVVTLRGLSLTGEGANNGVAATSFGALHVENCTISGFTAAGVIATAPGNLFIDNSAMHDDGEGVTIQPASGSVSGTVAHSTFERDTNTAGVTAIGVNAPVKLTIVASLFANDGNAVNIYGSEVNLQNCTVANNAAGLNLGSNGSASISGTMFVDNNLAVACGPEIATSFGNNQFSGNASNGCTLTPAAQR